MYCTICGYGGETADACPRCGATGTDLVDIPAMAQGPMYTPSELDLDRDEIGFTNPNLHRRAPDDLHIDGTYASINYPSSVPAAYSDIETTTEEGVMKISKYKGTETNICIPEVYVSAGVTTIGLGAFTDTDVVYVEIPDGITTIE